MRKITENKPDFQSTEELVDWKIKVWEEQYQLDDRVQCLWQSLTPTVKEVFYESIILNVYIPEVPFFQQILLLISDLDTLYGGARGGGKSSASLMVALQHTDISNWKVGIFRLTYPDLSAPGAILDRALDWLHEDRNPLLKKEGIAPHYDRSEKLFTFPSGAKIKFAQVQHDSEADKYQGAEFHIVIIDEAVLFTEYKIVRLKGSVRKQSKDPLPTRNIYTGNPGGVSHDYFEDKFIKAVTGYFIDSKYTDNIYLNHEKYEQIFEDIKYSDPILYRQWKYGDWSAIPQGKLFKREWFTNRLFTIIKEKIIRWVRYWDLAATKEEDPTKQGGPDWTAGGLFALGESGTAYLTDMVHVRLDEDEVHELIRDTAYEDGEDVIIRIEQEGGSSGKMVIGQISRSLPGFDCDGETVTRKSKLDRARAFVTFIKNGGLKIKDGTTWINGFLNEITSFPTKGIHDDQVDVISGGLRMLFNAEKPPEPELRVVSL